MTQFKWKTLLPALLILMTFSAMGTSVINSDDWKTVTKAQNHADLNDQEVFTLATPADAKIAANTIENPETLYTTESPTFAELERRTGLSFDQKLDIDSLNYTNHDGFVVLNDDFGTDAVAALPYAARNDYRILFYSGENRQVLENSTLPKIFYGEFGFDPAERFSDAEHINGTWQERNLELARRTDTDWAVLSPRSYFNPEMIEEEPVLFRMNRRRLADFIDNSSIERLKVAGAENMLYAKELDIITDKELEVAVKTGRAFTGIKGYDGIYGIKTIDTPYRRYNLDLETVSYSPSNSVLAVEFVNRGNTVREVNLSVDTGERKSFSFRVPEFSSTTYTFNSSGNFTDISLNYSTERTEQKSATFSSEEISSSSIEPLADLEVTSLNRSEGMLEIALRNTGEEPVWTMVQAGDGVSRVRIQPDETGRHVIEGVEDAESYTVFQGEFRNQYSYSTVRKIMEESRQDYTLLILVLAALLVVLAAVSYVVYEFTSISTSSLR